MHSAWAILVVGVVLWTAEEGRAKKIPRWWLKVAERQGPNACVVEEIPGTEKEFWTECRYWLNRKICGKKTRIRFECCEGFDQIEGEDGCTLVKPLRNLLETAEALGATKWASYIRESGLQNEFESAGAYTLFAPTNEAFDAIQGSLRSQMDSYRGSPSNPILLYHIVPTKLKSDDFDGDETIETRHQGHNLRINKYSNGMTTINCALLVRKDQEATNGIVHIIDGVLDPSVGIGNNVADMILTDGRFEVLAEMLEKSGYINVLRTMQGSITILAPSDEAFQKLADSRREKIINDREARLALLQNHVLPHVICESAITGEHKVRTMSDNKLTFNCDINGAYVETTKLRGNFNLGKNGIIHMIDDVLLPDRAKNLVELAESRQLGTFVDFVKKSGLEETLSHTGDYTFFVPDETAWLEMPPEAMAQARRDPEYAGLMLRFHGAYGRHLTNAINDNQGIMSLDEENPVRLQVWRRALGVEDAKITDSDLEAQNGVIHIINKVIFPSNRTIETILTSIRRHTFYTFLDSLEKVTRESPHVLNLGPGEDVFYTFFVPTDRAFNNFGQAELSRISSNPEELRKLVTGHIAVNMFPETAFEPGLIYSIDGISSNFNVKKTPDGKLKVNDANVLSSYMSANGVIHVIDKVFKPSEGETYSTVKKTSVSTVTHHNGSMSTHTYTSTRKTSGRTHHRRVTVNEGSDKHLEEVLPAFPQGSVIVGSTQRKPEYVFPVEKGKKSRRREGLKNRDSSQSSTSASITSTTGISSSSTTTLPPPPPPPPTTTASTTTSTSSSTTSTTTSTTTTTTPIPTTTTTTTTTPAPTTTTTTTKSPKPSTTERSTYFESAIRHDTLYSSRTSKERNTDDDLQIVQGSRVPVTLDKNTHVKKTYSQSHDYKLNKPADYTRKTVSDYDDQYKLTVEQTHELPSTYERQSVYSDYRNIARTPNPQFINARYDNSYYSKHNSSYYNIYNSSSASLNPKLTTYNRDWNVPLLYPLNTTTTYDYLRHATNISRFNHPKYISTGTTDLNRSRGSQLKHSKSYSYSYSRTLDGKPIDPSLHGNRFISDINSNNLLSSSSNKRKDNIIDPIPPEGGRFRYVGHPYGDDVVGHSSSEPLPFTSAGSSYVSRNSSTDQDTIRPIPPYAIGNGGSNMRGVSTITHSKSVDVTRTIITHPSSSSYLAQSSRSFSLPINKKPIPSIGLDGKPRSNLLSAYAFTGEERDFADGAEFSEARLPSEQVITVEQAKILRRQWRKKRHHQNKQKKHRKGRKRGSKHNRKQRKHVKEDESTLP